MAKMLFLDFIFPKLCLFCGSTSSERKMCEKCLSEMGFIKSPICTVCGLPFPSTEVSNHLCGKCLVGEFYFDRARSVASYKGVLKEVLHKFKYEGVFSFGGVLSQILVHNFPDDLSDPDLVVPVPLYLGRLKSREYNQSVILGKALAKYLGVSFDQFLLRRVRDTKPQFEVGGERERLSNVRGAFVVVQPDKIVRRRVLLIDDVFTTGATVSECARVLKKSGAKKIEVITLMRAV